MSGREAGDPCPECGSPFDDRADWPGLFRDAVTVLVVGTINFTLMLTISGLACSFPLFVVAGIVALPTVLDRTGIYRYRRKDMLLLYIGLGLSLIPPLVLFGLIVVKLSM